MTVTLQNLETLPLVVESPCPIANQSSLRVLPHLPAHGGDLSLVHAGLCHHIGQGASCQVLHHHPELLSYEVTEEPKPDFKIRMQRVLKLSYKCNKNKSCI